jgi:hypothetical protein
MSHLMRFKPGPWFTSDPREKLVLRAFLLTELNLVLDVFRLVCEWVTQLCSAIADAKWRSYCLVVHALSFSSELMNNEVRCPL